MQPQKRNLPQIALRSFSLLALAAVFLVTAPAAAQKPNIVFLLADDLRWDAVRFAGNPIVKTPHLDRLAKEGAVFRNAFVTTAICAVSRASIFSGQYSRRHGINDFATRFDVAAWERCYPELLKEAGYSLGFIGKFGVGNAAPTNTFDYWDAFNGQGRYLQPGQTQHLTARMGESAIKFLERNRSNTFCLSVSFKSPHAQDGAKREFPPDPRDESLYSDIQIPFAPSVSEIAFKNLPSFLQNSEGRTRWERRFATEEMRAATIRDYYRLITGMDREIGKLREELERLGLASNTIIIFTSDNGFYFGEHGLADKWFMHEESIRIPLVLHDPRKSSQGREVQQLALNIDIAPTLLDYAGVKIPAEMQGRSLRALAEGKRSSNWREEFFYEHHFNYGGKIPDSEGVRTERWKYIRYVGQEPVSESLFDLKNDPFELKNLAGSGKHHRTKRALARKWESYRERLK